MPTYEDGESGSSVRTKVNNAITAIDGLGSSNNVTITGGTITGITDLAVADGGTGASDAPTARTNLGVAIGSDVQAYDAGLNSISGLTTAADKMIYSTAPDTYAVTDLSSFGRTLIDDADASAARTTLSLGTIATQASGSVDIDGGSIDGTTIGATTPAPATVTTFTSTGIDDNATGTAVTIDGSSNVGIGTNSQATRLDVADEAPIIRLTDTRNLNNPDWDNVSLGSMQWYTSDTTTPGVRVGAEIEAFSGGDAASAPEFQLIFKSSTSNESATERGRFTAAGSFKMVAVTVANLPSASSEGAGSRHFVTDANATTFASIVAGGGSNNIPVYSDGTNWRIG